MSSRASTTRVARPLPRMIQIELTPLEYSALSWLEQERQRLMDKICQQEVELAEAGLITGNDAGDFAGRTYAQSKQLAMRRLWTAMLKEVERAIERVQRGTYGVCEHCGGPIPEERLRALPSAALCVHCAQLQVRNVRAA